MASESIDELLVRYLGLLHEYTDLRSQLAVRQSAMYANLARANFAAERGFRYGPDHFDGRMQALATLSLGEKNSGAGVKEDVPSFTVVRPKRVKAEQKEEDDKQKEERNGQNKDATQEPDGPKAAKKSKAAAKPQGPRDPLQWFGVLTPMALRQAQNEAVGAVDTIIPRLASLSAEMAAVEIEVRRARKKRSRAQEKLDKQTTDTKDGSDEKSALAVPV